MFRDISQTNLLQNLQQIISTITHEQYLVWGSKISVCFKLITQIAKVMGPTWVPPGSCRPQLGPMLASWTLISGKLMFCVSVSHTWWYAVVLSNGIVLLAPSIFPVYSVNCWQLVKMVIILQTAYNNSFSIDINWINLTGLYFQWRIPRLTRASFDAAAWLQTGHRPLPGPLLSGRPSCC